MNSIQAELPDLSNDDQRFEARVGRLLSPEEFALECARTHQRPKFQSWAVGFHLPDAVVRVMESALVPKGTNLALFSSSNGPVYPVAVFQAGALQLRVMLSLGDARAQEWLREAVTTGRMRLAIEIAETTQLAVMEMRCKVREQAEVEERIRQCVPLHGDKGFLDELLLAERLLEPAAIKSMVPGFEVQSVELVVVLAEGERLVQNAEAAPPGEAIH